MESLILQVFSNEELTTLTQEQNLKLENHLKSKEEQFVVLEGKIQKLRADYEQKCYDLDKKLVESASRLSSEATSLAKSTEKCCSLESEKQALEERCGMLESGLHEGKSKITSLMRITEGWDEERLNLQHLVEKRDVEITRLNDEWKSLSDRLSEATSGKNELQIKLDELMSSNVTGHYHSKRVEQENQLLSNENQQLNYQLQEKNDELLALRREKGNEIISLQGRLDLNRSENEQLKQIVTNIKTNETSMREKLNELQEKTTKASEDYHTMEQLHRSELQSQTRLAELYRVSAEDGEKKCDELVSAVEELQSLVKSSSQQNENLQESLKGLESKNMDHSIEIERLKKELETANDMIAMNKRRELNEEELAEMCPTAAMTSRFIKSGMTLTQIYAQYVEQSDELEVTKEENKRVNEAMDSILEELNAKAPILKRQREDYERALTTINQLTSQTDEAAIQFQQLRQEADDANRRAGIFERENQRFRKETLDLSKQVRFLLKEVEEIRGRKIDMSPQKVGNKSLLIVNDDGSCNDVSSSSELISQTLVTFKDIGELQEQNKKLLAVIRELSDKQEQQERDGGDERSKLMQAELEDLKDEVMRMREDRTRQSTMVEAIVRQRDMYRVLLAHNPQSGLPPSMLASPSIISDHSMVTTPPKATGAAPDAGSPLVTKKALLQLQEEFQEYKSDVLANNKVYEDKQEVLQTKLSDEQMKNAKLEAQLDFCKERFEMVKKNEGSSKKECDALREKNKQLYSYTQQHERTINNLTTELNSVQQLANKFQARSDSVKSLLDISKRAEDRLTAENQSLQREQGNLSVLLGNLQKMQQSMEVQAFEVRSQLHSRLEAQDRELIVLKQKINDLTQEKQDAMQGMEKQLQVLQKNLEGEKMKGDKLSTDLKQLKLDLETLEQDKQEVQTKLQIAEERLSSLGGKETDDDPGSSSILQLRREIKEKSDEIISLNTRLEKARHHVDHYREVSAAAEETVKQASETNKELIDTLQNRLEQSSETQTKLEQEVAKLQEENQSLKNEKYKVTGEVERQTADLRTQLVSVQTQLESSMRRTTEAITNEQIAREDLNAQVAKAEEANDNYQREMILHASAMKELMQLKERVKASTSDREELQLERSNLEQLIKEKEESWKLVEEKLTNENQQHVTRVQEIETQNETLHSQIQLMSGQMVELQSKASKPASPQKLYPSRDPIAVATAAAAETGGTSNQQLLDVIKFLRREKEISETKYELVQAEVLRYKQQLHHSDEQIKQIQTDLAAEQSKVQEQLGQLSELSTLKREVSNLRMVEKNNKKLREERDQLDADLRASNARMTSLQADLAPLQTKNREISAQCSALQSEKKTIADEATRWKERVQQMTQSPRRQDPEEYRKLMTEKSNLAKNLDTANAELSEIKSECSALKGQLRNLQTTVQTSKSNTAILENQAASQEGEIKKLKEDAAKQLQTMSKIRKVGRKFKLQYEDLLSKQQKKEEEAAGDAAAVASEDAMKKAEEKCSKMEDDMKKMQEELKRSQDENQELKSKQVESEKNVQKSDDQSKEIAEEVQALKEEKEKMTKALEDKKKQMDEMLEKEKRFSTLLSLAKSQIEKLRKDNQEGGKERERLNGELKKLENDRKNELEQRTDLQTKVEELQRQLLEGRHPTQVPELRKTRPSTQRQRVNQVTPMRVTRTARVMPEPQQETQELDRPAVVSSVPQAASSSTQPTVSQPVVVSVPVVSTLSSHATAFVHPMSPARQQPVVSSATPQATDPPPHTATDPTPSTEVNENEQAIVSSSDDQTNQDREQNQPRAASSAGANHESEASPSSSGPLHIAGATSSTSMLNPNARSFHSGTKRSHDDTDDLSLPSRSREAQVAVAPLPKRQRGSPDQSSESVPTMDAEAAQALRLCSKHSSGGLKIKLSRSLINPKPRVMFKLDETKAEKTEFDKNDVPIYIISDSELEGSSVGETRQPDQSQQSDAIENQQGDNLPDENEVEEYEEDEIDTSLLVGSSSQQEVATSSIDPGDSGADGVDQEEMIVISSDEDGADDDNSDQEFEDQADDDVINEEVDVENDEENENDTVSAISISDVSSVAQTNFPSSNLPFLVIQPTESARQRLPSRPGPLTPGIVMPSMTEDGDGIVPCTPTLVTHRHDEGYHAISSPRVPHGAGGQPIRFRFEDISSGNLFENLPGGVGSVDNTLMDLAAAGDDNSRSVPTTPVPQSTVFSQPSMSSVETSDLLPSTSGNAAVSSSIQEEEIDVENDELVPTTATSVERSETREASSIPTNTIRGRRRFRIIGAPRTRGRGANSPSTSNQP